MSAQRVVSSSSRRVRGTPYWPWKDHQGSVAKQRGKSVEESSCASSEFHTALKVKNSDNSCSANAQMMETAGTTASESRNSQPEDQSCVQKKQLTAPVFDLTHCLQRLAVHQDKAKTSRTTKKRTVDELPQALDDSVMSLKCFDIITKKIDMLQMPSTKPNCKRIKCQTIELGGSKESLSKKSCGYEGKENSNEGSCGPKQTFLLFNDKSIGFPVEYQNMLNQIYVDEDYDTDSEMLEYGKRRTLKDLRNVLQDRRRQGTPHAKDRRR